MIEFKTLLVVLAFMIPFTAMSQTTTFTPQKGASGRALTTVKMYTDEDKKTTENVQMQNTHELRQIIYIKPGETKRLLLQTKNNGDYYRWFRYDTHAALNKSYFSFNGASIKADLGKDGLKYTDRELTATVTSDMLSQDASKPTIIACDYSKYNDYGSSSEPTLMYRMIYELHPATEISTKLDKCTANATDTTYLEKYDMIAPNGGKKIIIGTKYPYMGGSNDNFQSNYYVNSGTEQVDNGTWYEQSNNGNLTKLADASFANNKQCTFTGSTSTGTHVYILKTTMDNKDYYIAKYTIDYQDATKVGPSDTEIYSDSYLSKNYKEIAANRFDFTDNLGNLPKDGLQNWGEPLPFDESTYGFIYKPSNYTENVGKRSTIDTNAKIDANIAWAHYAFLSSSSKIGFWAFDYFKDRLYERTNGAKFGYFYYVDAAETQGVVSKLDISKACCPGTGLHFSAWVANINKETGGQKMPNLNFQIVSTDNSGNETIIKTFTTGDFGSNNPATNKWMQIYFNFVIPRTSTDRKLYLKVINNQVSSLGDDFIIDDIVAYMEKPAIQAEQTALLCGPTAEVKVHINYDKMIKLGAIDGSPTLKKIPIGFCFVDSAKYMSEINSGIDKVIAIKDACVKTNNSTISGNNYISKFILEAQKGKSASDLYAEAPADKTNAELVTYLQNEPYVYCEKTAGSSTDNSLFFISEVNGYDLEPGKTYYSVFNISGDETKLEDLSLYSMDSPCDAYTSFVLRGTGRVLVDGQVDLYDEAEDFCYNLTPTFTITQLSYKVNNETKWVDTKAVKLYFDWFRGNLNNFYTNKYTTSDNSQISAQEALFQYRSVYPTQSDPTLPAINNYTEADREVILKLTSDHSDDNNTLILKKKSLTPTVSATGKTTFVAIPVVATYYDPTNQYVGICLDEQIIAYKAKDKAPKILYGIPGVNYGDREVVPMRLGKKHMLNATGKTIGKYIDIPIRSVETITSGSTKVVKDSNHTLISDSLYLIDTNDTAYEDKAVDFTPIGKIEKIVADQANSNTATTINNYIRLYFDEDFAKNIKEGYTYKMKFAYAERNSADNDYTNACDGNTCVMFKIVPEYENWTGDAQNNDWNNDKNWKRSDNADLYKSKNAYDSNVINTTNNGFAPLDFTYITMLKGTKNVPVLLALGNNNDNVLNVSNDATKDIAYDMAIKEVTGSNYACRIYYQNTCKELYMKPEAEIMNTQLLNYNKAHVDLELTKNRWYLLTSPLRGVVAGDMYAPKGTARQETDAFADITFDNTLANNNRFNPAVYQRSWDQNSSIVYEYVDGTSTGDTKRNVYIKANWSNVYNDVDVNYAPGVGFSIKPQVSTEFTGDKTLFRLPKSDTSYSYFTADGRQGQSKDIIRTASSTDLSGNTTNTDVSGRLFTDFLAGTDSKKDVSVNVTTINNKLFLTGNPFPCQLNMQKFFDVNTNLEKKYWILSGSKQDAVIFSNDGEFVSTIDGTTTVAPMQGFFVKAPNANTSATITFNTAMMTGLGAGISSPGLRAKSATNDAPSKLYLSTANNNIVLVRDSKADNGFNEKEEVETIEDSNLGKTPLIYSIAGDKAVQINQFCSSTMIPLGILNANDSTVAVRFSGSDAAYGNVSLYDTADGSRTNILSNTTLTLRGGTPGRYFIVYGKDAGTTDIKDASVDNISILTTFDNTVQITSAPSDPLTDINIVDAEGKTYVNAKDINANSKSYNLNSGLYIVKAKNSSSCKIVKIFVK